MAIFEVTETQVVQRCANCDQEARHPIASLQVGPDLPGGPPPDPGVISLPACATCKSVEFLLRTPDGEPEHSDPGSFGHLHRMLVNHLHSELVKAHRVHPQLKDKKGKADQKLARPVSQADRDKYFAKGMKVPQEIAAAFLSAAKDA